MEKSKLNLALYIFLNTYNNIIKSCFFIFYIIYFITLYKVYKN